MTVARGAVPGASNGTRGVFLGGHASPNTVIDYITIATPGNATDFGDLLDVITSTAAAAGDA